MNRHVKRTIVGLMTTVLAAGSLVVAAGPSQATDSQITLNSAGGSTAVDGIQIVYQHGQWQVLRNGVGQLYGPGTLPRNSLMFNSVFLTVSGEGTGMVVGAITPDSLATGFTAEDWDTVNTVGPSSTGSGSFTSTLSKTINDRTYQVNLATTYTFPNDFMTQTYSVVIPAGNTANVKLYTPYDTYLGVSDLGPGYFLPGPPAEVGVQRPSVVEAIQYVSGPAWAGYASANYRKISFSSGGASGWGQGFGTNYPNDIDPNPDTDNGIGVNWDFGVTPGTTTPAVYKFFFTLGTPPTPATPATPTAQCARFPKSIAPSGDTVVISKICRTSSGQRVRVTAACRLGRMTVRGDLRTCKIVKGQQGKRSLRTFGSTPLRVTLTFSAPATTGYSAFRKSRSYRIR